VEKCSENLVNYKFYGGYIKLNQKMQFLMVMNEYFRIRGKIGEDIQRLWESFGFLHLLKIDLSDFINQ
jgi:hypothetical protein